MKRLEFKLIELSASDPERNPPSTIEIKPPVSPDDQWIVRCGGSFGASEVLEDAITNCMSALKRFGQLAVAAGGGPR